MPDTDPTLRAEAAIVDARTARPALAAFRRLLRVRRRGNADRGDLLYRAYVTVLLGVFGSYLALGAVDSAPIGPDEVGWIRTHGAAWVGMAAAAAIAAGLRSGATGGPLALDSAELHHVVMAPIDRRLVLRSSVYRLLATAAIVGGLVGIAAGELAQRRLPGSTIAWLASGVLTGMTITVGAAGVALTTAAMPVFRARPSMASALAMGLVVWAALDIVQEWQTAPTTVAGRIALWPIDFTTWAVAAPIVVLAMVGFGRDGIARMSMERAARRSHLIRQVRFALAQQDIRSLILLRRRLGFERPRGRPYVRVSPGRFGSRNPVVYRDLCSYLRWPPQRVIRVAALAAVAGLALAGVWRGTTAFALAFAAVAYLASLEVVEPFSQEIDHRSILAAAPVDGARVLVVHMFVATAVMAVLLAVAAGVAAAMARSVDLLVVVAASAVPAAAAAVGGAAISNKQVGSGDSVLFMPDEIAGPAALVRIVLPVSLAGLAALPVVLAERAAGAGNDPLGGAWPGIVGAAVAGLAMMVWIRMRDEITASMAQAGPAAQGKNEVGP